MTSVSISSCVSRSITDTDRFLLLFLSFLPIVSAHSGLMNVFLQPCNRSRMQVCDELCELVWILSARLHILPTTPWNSNGGMVGILSITLGWLNETHQGLFNAADLCDVTTVSLFH